MWDYSRRSSEAPAASASKPPHQPRISLSTWGNMRFSFFSSLFIHGHFTLSVVRGFTYMMNLMSASMLGLGQSQRCRNYREQVPEACVLPGPCLDQEAVCGRVVSCANTSDGADAVVYINHYTHDLCPHLL